MSVELKQREDSHLETALQKKKRVAHWTKIFELLFGLFQLQIERSTEFEETIFYGDFLLSMRVLGLVISR